ncbi:hypothetical protein OVA03_15475 [Asticcacaulis sp. SL142]|uniref:hypothetical protein n=1 Tax=Asticcacaulis sp. SL142 TaxID=2995155 RepID=UPI00226CF5F8|nr:hypothetical protein [Asticcacaulis sp. SL142]WAC48076.1 hypothetical protein OVA03_15475 [Asticcacaulis sp. SL142]
MENLNYPYIYRPSSGTSVQIVLLSPVLIFMYFAFVFFGVDARPLVQLFIVAIVLLLVFAIVYSSMLLGRGYLELYPDYLEYCRIYEVQRIERSDIAAFKWGPSRSGIGSIIVGLKNKSNLVNVPYFGDRDSKLTDWFSVFPDLDETTKATRERLLLDNPAFGTDEAARVKKIRYDKNTIIGAAVLSGLISGSAFVFFKIHDVLLYICIVIPVLAVAAIWLSRGRWAVYSDGLPAKLNLSWVMFWPVVPLGFWGFHAGRPVNEWAILGWAFILTCVILWIVCTSRDGKAKWYLAVAFVPHFIYAFGALSLINSLPAREAKIYEVVPSEVKAGTGRKSSSYVVLPPWGPVTEVQRVGVSRSFAKSLRHAEPVCAHLYTGALGWPYYSVDKCTPKPAPPSGP